MNATASEKLPDEELIAQMSYVLSLSPFLAAPASLSEVK